MKKAIKKAIPQPLFDVVEPTGHKLETIAASARAGFPAKKLRVIGVTGTNGKTSTAFMIFTMLKNAGKKVGIISTVACGVGDDVVPQSAHVTTSSGPVLQKQFVAMARQDVEWVVLETTSHALAQYRVWGVPFEIAVLTNITHEHLDYHKTFERYVAAKRKLFEMTAQHKNGYGVINAEDPQAQAFADTMSNSVSYGIHAGGLRAKNIVATAQNTTYQAEIDGQVYAITCNIPGEFNVYNSLAAIAVGRRIGLSVSQIEQGIALTTHIDGRMVRVDEGQPYTILVDFAHTPDAFERLLKSVRQTVSGKLVVLFGSAGRRDQSKREIQGNIAAQYADEVILTEEDDRDCDGLEIIEQIAVGVEASGGVRDETYFCVHDRTEAIAFALGRVSDATDAVVFLGKGHEKTIERADGEHPWDEVSVIQQTLGKIRDT